MWVRCGIGLFIVVDMKVFLQFSVLCSAMPLSQSGLGVQFLLCSYSYIRPTIILLWFCIQIRRWKKQIMSPFSSLLFTPEYVYMYTSILLFHLWSYVEHDDEDETRRNCFLYPCNSSIFFFNLSLFNLFCTNLDRSNFRIRFLLSNPVCFSYFIHSSVISLP